MIFDKNLEKEDRFVVTENSYIHMSKMIGIDTKVIVDRETGVNYVATFNGIQLSTFTPLIDAEGKPLITLLK